jgi:DNA-binding NtrC family response regulator
VRELRNVVERAVVLADGPRILPAHLPPDITANPPRHHRPGDTGRTMTLREVESRHIAHVLVITGGNRLRAAYLLGIHRNTLRRRIHQYGLGDAGRVT